MRSTVRIACKSVFNVDIHELRIKMTPISFIGNNPGAVKHGNFINYYQFHPVKDRLKGFPSNIWCTSGRAIFSCLDVGCNSGELTQSLWEFVSSHLNSSSRLSKDGCEPRNIEESRDVGDCYMLGLDLDKCLIDRANENNERTDHISFKTCNVMDEEEVNHSVLSFKKDMLKNSQEQCFDAVFLFSVSMWIHINHGDEGFRKFLVNSANLSKNLIVVEPQRWKSYLAANRRCVRSGGQGFPLLKELKIRGDATIAKELERIFSECGFRLISETEESNWGRKTLFFQKTSK